MPPASSAQSANRCSTRTQHASSGRTKRTAKETTTGGWNNASVVAFQAIDPGSTPGSLTRVKFIDDGDDVMVIVMMMIEMLSGKYLKCLACKCWCNMR